MSQVFVAEFFSILDSLPLGPRLFNPWRESSPDDAEADSPSARRSRLQAHLSNPAVRYLIVGEAPSFAGCRVSGIPFTSEALLLEGAIPRVPVQHRLTKRLNPWSEMSARILWELLYRHQMAESVILWNALPFHPQGIGGALSNRTPTAAEMDLGLPLLECLQRHHPTAKFLGVGLKSCKALAKLSIEHVSLRHPAYGGKPELSAQLQALRKLP